MLTWGEFCPTLFHCCGWCSGVVCCLLNIVSKLSPGRTSNICSFGVGWLGKESVVISFFFNILLSAESLRVGKSRGTRWSSRMLWRLVGIVSLSLITRLGGEGAESWVVVVVEKDRVVVAWWLMLWGLLSVDAAFFLRGGLRGVFWGFLCELGCEALRNIVEGIFVLGDQNGILGGIVNVS